MGSSPTKQRSKSPNKTKDKKDGKGALILNSETVSSGRKAGFSDDYMKDIFKRNGVPWPK
jgi:hypothetical protein